MPYKVTIDNYVDLAGRTEAPITEEIRARVSDPRIAASLLHNLELFAVVAGWLDKLKKHIFYGKALPDSFFLADQKRATAEVMERLQDEQILRLLHGVLGIGTEAGELVNDDHKGKLKGILPVLEGAPIDGWNFLEETGDTEWYAAQIIRVIQTLCYDQSTLQDVLQTNIDKLEARYPEKFTEDKAINRDLETEQQILEGEGSNPKPMPAKWIGGKDKAGWSEFQPEPQTTGVALQGQLTPPDKWQTEVGKHDVDLAPGRVYPVGNYIDIVEEN